MNKRLAILGANASISVLIRKAKSLGYETHVFAWACGDPGEKEADFFYPISLIDKELILQKCRKIGVCGVCSITSDFAAPVVAYVARGLGLPGNPEKTDIVARNKYEMRKAFQKYGGIYCPKFAEVDDSFCDSAVTGFQFPVIVKPTDRWSSKGITRVDSKNELQKAVNFAVSESIEKKAIIEEFMDGPEYSAECIVYEGEPTVLTFTKKNTTGFPHYIETGHTQPSDIPLREQEKIKEKVKRAIRALDITNSAAHAEFRILKNGEIGFMEIGARMGGDCIGTDLTPISTGMDYTKMVIDVACGNAPDFTVFGDPQPISVRFILNSDDFDRFECFVHEYPSKVVRYEINQSQINSTVVDSSTRHGFYIFYCKGV
ncbi:MAG: ATP-grasp domain-containing protein [Sphaerochaeta sp.]